jgi:RNA polymerase sigma-70 factor (ECF subfamily)
MDAAPLPDEELVQRTLAGDSAALELLVQRHMPAVFTYARSKIHNVGAAEEVAQDTFDRASRKLASFRHEASLRTWLLRICHRCCIDHLRRHAPTTASIDDTTGRVVPLVSALAAQEHHDKQRDADLRSRLQEEISRLSPQEREAFVLVCVRGHTREEAATILGVPPSTMRDRVTRARMQLATKFGDYRAEVGEA